MKKILLLMLLVLPCAVSLAQTYPVVISGRATDQQGNPIPFVSIRVCPATSPGTPCSPTAPIYSDYGLTNQLPNPTTADQFGNFAVYAAPLSYPGLYVVQFTTPQGQTFSYPWNGTAGNGAASGFPIILGTTSIAAGSTTTELDGLTVNGVLLSDAGPDTEFLNKTGAYSTPAGASLPSCTASQLLYYDTTGTIASCLTLGTNLSITSGTLNASGGGSSLTLQHNGTALSDQSLLNFNDTTPAAPSGNSNVTFQSDADGDLSGYVPTAAGSPLTTKGDIYGFGTTNDRIPVGTNGQVLTANSATALGVDWESSSGVQYNPADTTYIVTGSSVNNDDDHVLSTPVAVSAWTCTLSANCVFTVANTTGLVAGSWVFLPQSPAGTAPGCVTPTSNDQGIGYPGCGYGQVLSAGLTSTQFEVAYTGSSTTSCSSSCGNYQDADYFMGPQIQLQPYFKGHGTVYWPTCASSASSYTLACMAANMSSTYGSFPDGTPTAPVYFIIDNFEDDSNASTAEGDLATIWEYAHAHNWIVVEGTTWPHGTNAAASNAINTFIYGSGKVWSNEASGDYWDILSDAAPEMANGPYQASNGGFNPAGVGAFAAKVNSQIANVNSMPSDTGNYLLGGGSATSALNLGNGSAAILFNGSNGGINTSGGLYNIPSVAITGGLSSVNYQFTDLSQYPGNSVLAMLACSQTPTGDYCAKDFGRDNIGSPTTNNDVRTYFNYAGNGSTANSYEKAFYSGAEIYDAFATGDLAIGSTTDPGVLLGVGSANQFKVDASGNVSTTGTMSLATSQSTVSCSTSGSVIFSEPLIGSSYKKIAIYENACVGTASYTYPTAFTYTPQVLSQSLASTAAASTTAVTVTGATSTGFVQLDGF